MRAVSITHVEYEPFRMCLRINIDELAEYMATDDVSMKRFKQGVKNVAAMLKGMMSDDSTDFGTTLNTPLRRTGVLMRMSLDSEPLW